MWADNNFDPSTSFYTKNAETWIDRRVTFPENVLGRSIDFLAICDTPLPDSIDSFQKEYGYAGYIA